MSLVVHPSKPPVVFYRYEQSPYARKISNALLLKNIAHYEVDVSRVLPRPELSSLLGIGYRRIPLLAIGNDIYCDTSLIAAVLERAFPPEQGYGTLNPNIRGTSSKPGVLTMEAYSSVYIPRVLFPLGSGTLPWDQLPDAFVKDRSGFLGANIDPKAMLARQPALLSAASTHLLLLEQQLSDGREWIFNTETPSLADISTHFIYAWMSAFPAVKAAKLFDPVKIPLTVAWLNHTSEVLKEAKKSGQAVITKATGQQAAELITARTAHTGAAPVVQFDTVEAERLQLILGERAAVAPEDTGRNFPTFGKLIGLDREEIVLETQGTAGTVRCHFPRIGYFISKAPESVIEKVVNTVKAKL